MEAGERLAAYLAGDLDADERAAIEAQLARDPALRQRLERIRHVDALLGGMEDVEPRPGFRERLDDRLRTELGGDVGDELADRRERRRRVWRPVAVAAAAAAIVGVVGVTAGVVLRGGGAADRAETTAMAPQDAGPEIGPYDTTNDYTPQELQRLAVNVDLTEVLPSGLTRDEAQLLADRYQGQLIGPDDAQASGARTDDQAAEPESDAAAGLTADTPMEMQATDAPAYQRCLPEVLAGSPDPLVPVYVELARFEGEPAVIYAFASPDPDTGTYRRIQVWAVAEADCHVFNYTSYDRE